MSQLFKDPNFQRQIILENYKNPKNRSLVEDDTYKSVHMDSESCVDDIMIQILFEENVIKDIRFDGEACTISTSTASMMIKLLIGKTKEEALYIIDQYNSMIYEKPYEEEVLEEANVFNTIYKQPNRIKCALLPWDGIKKLLEES